MSALSSLPVSQGIRAPKLSRGRHAANDDMKVREVLRVLLRDGWYVARTRGSHRQLKHPVKSGKVTLPEHPADELHPDTLKSVLHQAGLEEED